MRSLVAALVAIFLLGPVAHAQPTVRVSAEPRDAFTRIVFTFEQDDLPSMTGCHYNFFAANKASDLEKFPGKSLSIATFFRPLPVIRIIAGPLPHLARTSTRRKRKTVSSIPVYFRALISCPSGTDGLSEILTLEIPTFPKGTLQSADGLTRSMKFHMQYYEP